jgi:hypothetical protein
LNKIYVNFALIVKPDRTNLRRRIFIDVVKGEIWRLFEPGHPRVVAVAEITAQKHENNLLNRPISSEICYNMPHRDRK